MTTIKDALDHAMSTLAQADQPASRLDAQVLLGYVLNVDRARLYAYPERLLTQQQEEQFHLLLERRKRGEPVAYLVGHKEFFGLAILAAGHTPLVADIGTGSGAIPITLAVQEPRLPYLYATDISAEALEVARINCQRHSVEQRVRLLHGDLLSPLPEPVDVLTANLPYVGTGEMDMLAPDVRTYEPHLALFSGTHGLDLLYRFFTEAQQSGKLKEYALLLLEIGYQQREPLKRLLSELWPQATVTFAKDFSGWDRLIKVIL